MRKHCSIIVALAVTASTVMADSRDPKPTKVQPNPDNLDTTVLRDAAGGTYVLVGSTAKSDQRQLFYGVDKTLYLQRNKSFSAQDGGKRWRMSVWTPRIVEYSWGGIEKRDDGSFFRDCAGKDDAVLTEVTGDKANEVLTKYSFMSSKHVRAVHALARDDNGVYYYVDTLLSGAGYRLFIGKKGAMKQVSLNDIATDPAGELYITRTGTLKIELVTTRPQPDSSTTRDVVTATWIKGERKTPLTWLDFKYGKPEILVMIYRELGVYGSLGTICDNV